MNLATTRRKCPLRDNVCKLWSTNPTKRAKCKFLKITKRKKIKERREKEGEGRKVKEKKKKKGKRRRKGGRERIHW